MQQNSGRIYSLSLFGKIYILESAKGKITIFLSSYYFSSFLNLK